MGDVAIPDTFKNAKPAGAFAALDPTTDSLDEGIGSSYGVIHYKGKVWSLRYGGQNYPILRPDDGSPSNYIDCIILRQAHDKSKSYYQGYDPNTSGQRPLCSSLNGVTPDLDAPVPQATACAICPRNQWKTDTQGRKTRECSEYKRLAVLLLPSITKQFLPEPLMEPVFLRVPAGSLTNLGDMGKTMSSQGWHYSAYITRVKFDPQVAHPKMVFQALQGLSDAEAPVILPLREDTLTKRITGEDKTSDIKAAALPPAQHTAQIAQQAQPQVATQTAQGVESAPTFLDHAPVSGGTEPRPSGGVLELSAGQPPQQAQQADQEPNGDIQESDEHMDERIADLLKNL